MQLVFQLLPLIHLVNQRQICILCIQHQFHRPILGSCKRSCIFGGRVFQPLRMNYRFHHLRIMRLDVDFNLFFFVEVGTELLQIQNRIDLKLFFLKARTQLHHDSHQSEIKKEPLDLDLNFHIRTHISVLSFLNKLHRLSGQQLVLVIELDFSFGQVSVLSQIVWQISFHNYSPHQVWKFLHIQNQISLILSYLTLLMNNHLSISKLKYRWLSLSTVQTKP